MAKCRLGEFQTWSTWSKLKLRGNENKEQQQQKNNNNNKQAKAEEKIQFFIHARFWFVIGYPSGQDGAISVSARDYPLFPARKRDCYL